MRERLRTGRRVSALVLCPSLLNASGQCETVEQEKLGEVLYFGSFLFSEFFLFFVCRVVTSESNNVSQLRHRRSELVLLGQSNDSLFEALALDVATIRANCRGRSLKDFPKHHPSTRPVFVSQAVHRLLVVLFDFVRGVLGRGYFLGLGVSTLNFKIGAAWIPWAKAWFRTARRFQPDDNALTAAVAHVEGRPHMEEISKMLSPKYATEPSSKVVDRLVEYYRNLRAVGEVAFVVALIGVAVKLKAMRCTGEGTQ